MWKIARVYVTIFVEFVHECKWFAHMKAKVVQFIECAGEEQVARWRR